VYLPANDSWFCFPEGGLPLTAAITGGAIPGHEAMTPLEKVPVFIRAGAIIPMRVLEQFVGQLPKAPLTFDVYPGPDSQYQLYQDDGLSTDYQTKGAFRLTDIESTTTATSRAVGLTRVTDAFTPAEDFFLIRWLNAPPTAPRAPVSVTLNGTAVAAVLTQAAALASASNAYFYDPTTGTILCKVFDNAAVLAAQVNF
jgi:alpha-glucosidase